MNMVIVYHTHRLVVTNIGVVFPMVIRLIDQVLLLLVTDVGDQLIGVSGGMRTLYAHLL
jgi:hypothetical protein